MTAHRLLQEVRNRDIRITAQGEHLIVHARRGALTPALREALQTHKCEVIAELRTKADPHRDNESIAEVHGLTLADLEQVAGPDWPEIENGPATLGALANSITIRRMREHGEVPSNYTSTTICRHCGGPVPIYPGMAERVLGCPWCFNRAKGLRMSKAPTKTQVQDLGPAMLKREGCEGHKWSDYYPSEKVRVAKMIHEVKEIQE